MAAVDPRVLVAPEDVADKAPERKAMHILTSARHVDLSPVLLSHLEESLDRSIGRFAHRVRTLDVHFVDENGPRGGVDIRCRMLARIEPRGTVVVDDVRATPGQAAEAAADRLARQLTSRIRRRRDLARSRRTDDIAVQ